MASWHPDPNISRQREQNMRDWKAERARDGSGFSLPPCGCVFWLLGLGALAFMVVFCCFGGYTHMSACAGTSNPISCAWNVVNGRQAGIQ